MIHILGPRKLKGGAFSWERYLNIKQKCRAQYIAILLCFDFIFKIDLQNDFTDFKKKLILFSGFSLHLHLCMFLFILSFKTGGWLYVIVGFLPAVVSKTIECFSRCWL